VIFSNRFQSKFLRRNANTNTTEEAVTVADTEVGMEEVTMTITEAEVEISAVILEALVVDSVKGSTVSEISIKEVRKKSKKKFESFDRKRISSRRTIILPNPEYPVLTNTSNSMKIRRNLDQNSTKPI